MCPIDWCAFTWEAFATLVTGLAAVGGATLVGLRQASLQGLDIRLQLFERRYEVLRGIEEYMAWAIQLRRVPPDELASDFLRARSDAAYLFSKPVVDQLRTLESEVEHLISKIRDMEAEGMSGGQPSLQAREEFRQARAALSDFHDRLQKSLGQEMSIRPRWWSDF